ncbi:DUF7144 family membrane protein [Nocardia noduli]|uniref:DUF7144 family membrane protein n=1 Tax=Nocardia noduli TaxID=2815722 RepID=UPI001C21A1C0|nr:hypothetical protein [Nocardia noduli]
MVNEKLCPGCMSPVRYSGMNSPPRQRIYRGHHAMPSTPRPSVASVPPVTYVEEAGLSSRQAAASVAAIAWAVFLIAAGTMSILLGVLCFAGDHVVLADIAAVYRLGAGAMGWIHLGLGAALILCGVGSVVGRTWARIGAVICAMASIVADFAWLPHYPGWAAVVITVKVAAIWAMAVWHPADM